MSETRKHLPEWVKEGIITEEQEQKLTAWLDARQSRFPGMMFWLSLLAGLLVGLGTLLIIAHNWDNLPHSTKLILSLMPAVIGACLMLFAAFRRRDSLLWMELGSLLQFIGIGASIALISQVYHVNGSMESYLFAWLLVFTPTQILFSGRFSLLLYLILATWFVCAAGFNAHSDVHTLQVLWMLGCIMHSLRNLHINKDAVSFLKVFSWVFPPCFALGYGTLAFKASHPELLFLDYAGLMGLMVVAGEWLKTYNSRYSINGMRFYGRLGLLVIFSLFSYRFFWEKVVHEELFSRDAFYRLWLLWIGIFQLALIGVYGIYGFVKQKNTAALQVEPWFAIVFGIAFFLFGKFMPLAGMISTNILMLMVGVSYLQKGVKGKSLLWLNYGLVWLAVLLICRFSDVNQSYLLRGLFFIGIGILLFGVNVYAMRQRGKEETHVG